MWLSGRQRLPCKQDPQGRGGSNPSIGSIGEVSIVVLPRLGKPFRVHSRRRFESCSLRKYWCGAMVSAGRLYRQGCGFESLHQYKFPDGGKGDAVQDMGIGHFTARLSMKVRVLLWKQITGRG